ncbi:MAG: type IV toxin-antitoxin system AbiEi family antitoxin [Candidatus Dormibacterales bacterium]
MNRADGRRLEAEAIRILREIPGVEVIREPRHGPAAEPDIVLRAGGKRTPVMVEVKNRANAATAWQLFRYAQTRRGTPLLLIASETTAEARRILADHGIGLVDGLGNAHVELPGVLLHLQAQRTPRLTRTAGPPTRLRGKAGVAAVALLLNPDRAWRVRDLAAEAQVATGLAHRVLARLESEGVVTAEGVGRNRTRLVTDRAALLDLWTEESTLKTAPTFGYALAQTPQQLVRTIGTRLEHAGIAHAFTGAAAGAFVAPFITAVPVIDLYVTEQVAETDLLAAAEVEQVPDGQNVVFQQAADDAPLAFRQEVASVWIVNRFRLYADLKRDPRRGREQAENLRRELIGF